MSTSCSEQTATKKPIDVPTLTGRENGESKSIENDVKPPISLGGAASWGLPTEVKMEINHVNQCADKKDIKPAHVPVAKHLRGSLPFLEQSGDVIVGKNNVEAKMLGIGLPKLRSYEKEGVDKAKRFAMEQSVKVLMLRHATKHQENQQKIAMYAGALSMMSKVYCGNVALDVREDQIRQMFNPFGPVKQINMSYDQATGMHKGFAFVEFEVPEAAELALHHMNGALCSGKILKCSKIDGVMHGLAGAEPIIKQIQMEARQHHRIYVASIHNDLTESEVKEVFMAFGTILDCTLASHSANKHRGYGYITFERVQAANEAVASMNMFDLGGLHLRVIRAITPPSAQVFTLPSEAQKLPAASAVAAANVTAKIVNLDSTNAAYSQAQAAAAAAQKSPYTSYSKPASPASTPTMSGAAPSLISSPSDSANLATTAAPAVVSAVSSPYQASTPATAAGTPPSVASPQPSTTTVQNASMSPSQSPLVQLGSNSPARRSKFGDKVSDVAPPSLVDSVPVSLPKASFNTPSSVAAATLASIQNGAAACTMTTSSSTSSIPAEAMAEMEAMAAAFQSQTEEPTIEKEDQAQNGNKKQDESKKESTKDEKQSSRQSKKKRKRSRRDDDRDDRKRKDDRGDRHDNRRADRNDRRNDDRGRSRDDDHSNRTQREDTGGGGGSIYAQEKAKLLKSKDQRTMLMQKLMKKNASNVVILRNMVDASDVDDELQIEIQEECSKFGTVNRVIICQERYGGVETDITVKIFVQFAQPQEAEKAVGALDGRYFGGKTIKAEVYDQKLFECGDYTN